ncbi:hypothetical protein GF377_08020 [candidate division GN15 bacterium]|nr:hypothetical protein [candidate division GN15 bacterium]
MAYAHSGILVLFLLALVMVLKLREPIRAYNRESYHHIAGGLTILAISALARVGNDLGIFQAVPFFSEAIFYDLALWITGITGASLLVAGVTTWLPMARKHQRHSESRLRRLELLKHVEQLVGVENRLDQVLDRSLSYMVDHFGLAGGIVAKYSNRDDQLVPVGKSGGTTISDDMIADIRVDLNAVQGELVLNRKESLRLLADRPSGMPKPWRVLPIIVGHRLAGVLVLWADRVRSYQAEDDLTLRLVVDIIVKKIEQDRLTLRAQAAEQTRVLQTELTRSVSTASEPKEAFAGVVGVLRRHMPVAYAALSILGRDGSIERRYSMGSDKRVLLESQLPRPQAGSLTAGAFDRGETVVIADLRAERRPLLSEIVVDIDTRSLVAVPVMPAKGITAVLLLAADEPRVYNSRHQRQLAGAAIALMGLVSLDRSTAEHRVTERRLSQLVRLTDMVGHDATSKLIPEAASTLAMEPLIEAVRISVVEDAGSFLKSQALVAEPGGEGLVPADGSLVMSLLPLHREVLQSGKTTVSAAIPADDSPARIEMRQMFGMQPAAVIIAPIAPRGKTVGTVSAAVRRRNSPGEIDPSVVQFVEAVATALAAAMVVLGQAIKRDREAADSRTSIDIDRRSRLRSWLTGILGSVELIQTHRDTADEATFGRYMNILDTSARKIGEMLKEEEAVS